MSVYIYIYMMKKSTWNLAWAMSRATTSEPVRASRVLEVSHASASGIPDRVLREGFANVCRGLVEIDADHLRRE